jgi:drug/metabolite transporter (DMT)-like permease
MIRIAVRHIDPATLVFGRTAVASVILIPLAVRQRSFASLKGAWGWLVLYSVVEMGVPWLCMSKAEETLTSSLTGLLTTTTPLIALVITRFVRRHELIGGRRLVGLAIGFAGVICVVGLTLTTHSMLGLGLMCVVIVGYSTGPMIIAQRLAHADGLAVVAGSVVLVCLAYTPYATAHAALQTGTSGWTGETMLCVLGLGVLCTAGSFLCFFALIKEIGPSRTVVVTYLNTAVAVLIGVLALHEPFTAGLAIGFPLIIVGSYFATTTVNAGAHPPVPRPQ